MAINWFKYSSPASFYSLAEKIIPIFIFVALILLAAGLYVGFFVAPTDFQQGEAYRIIFIHVPAAWMSMFLYVVMAFWAGIGSAVRECRWEHDPGPGHDAADGGKDRRRVARGTQRPGSRLVHRPSL